nr:hypothetical protein [Muribacter muris]
MEDNNIKGKTLKEAHIAEAIISPLSPLENRTTLKLPLKSHGYLFEIISKWKPVEALQCSTPNRPLIQSKTTGAVKEALEWSNNG